MAYYKVNTGDFPYPTDVNQYADSLTGNNDVGQLTLAANVANPSAGPTAALAAGSALGIGAYSYAMTYVTGYKKTNGTFIYNGETALSPVTTINTTSGNQVVNLSNITTSSASYVIARRIYRTKVNPSTAPTLSASGTGNTLPSGTYFVKFTWVYTGGGESLPSPEASQAVTSGQALNVTIPSFPSGVASANIYVSTSSGTETLQRNITTTSTSFTAPLSAGASPPSSATFYKLTEIGDNVTTTAVDNTPDNSLTITAPTSNTTGTYFNTIYVGPDQRGQMFANGQTMVHVQNKTGSLFHESQLAQHIAANAYYDGTNWQRFNTANSASCITVQTNGEPQYRSIGPGANPISWNVYNIFHEGNFSTRTHVETYLSSNQTFTTANSWYRVIFNAITIDYLTEFDPVNGYITVLNAGIYSITYTLRFENLYNPTTIITGTNQLNRSGNYYNVTQTVVTSPNANIHGAQVLYLPAGTQLEIRAQVDNTNGGTARIGGYNYTTFAEFSRIA
jgi:hypothetical protein